MKLHSTSTMSLVQASFYSGNKVVIINKMIPELHIGDIARLRKVHPCGSYEWRIIRIGVDIGMVCLGCERRVLIPRSTFNKRVKIITPAPVNDQQD